MSRPAIAPWTGGVRGQIVLTVLVVSAVLYSALATIAFLLIRDNGVEAVRERVTEVVDRLDAQLQAGVATVRLATPDGVVATAVLPGGEPQAASGEIRVTR